MTSLIDAPPDAPPRYRNVPPSVANAGAEAVELAAVAGLHLDPWQQDVLTASLGERADGTWAATEVALVVPRQNGKGAILEARELFGLVLGGEKLITHTAHRFDTSKEHFRRMVELFEGCDELGARVQRIRFGAGDESIELKNGARLNFKARSKGSGRGFSGDLVVIDEAFYLFELASLLPTMSARPNAQIWYTSSAPVVGPESDVLRGICVRGRKGGDRMAYLEWSNDLDADPDDRDAWNAANPAMGYRLSHEFTEIERATLTLDEFRRERLGIWNPDEARPKEIPEDAWRSLQDSLAVPADPMTFAVEMTPDRMAASIVAVGAGPDGVPVGVVVEHRERESAPAWLIPALKALQCRDPKAILVDPKSAAGTLIPDLELAGVTVTECGLREQIQAAAGLFDSILAGDLKVRPAAPLDAAVATAARRDVAGSWLWKSNPVTPATPLVALGMALWGFTQVEAPPVDMAAQVF